MEKEPSFQFYYKDWLTDANLRRCTPLARAVWIDLICTSFDCEERGVFGTNARPWTREELARAVPGDSNQNLSALDELVEGNILKTNKAGFLFVKRVVSDEQKRQTWRKDKKNQRLTEEIVRSNVHSMSGLSSSSSASSSPIQKREEKPFRPTRAVGLTYTQEFLVFFSAYPQSRRLGKKPAFKAWVKGSCEGHLGEILASLEAWKANEWKGRESQYVPLPASWINSESWKENPLPKSTTFTSGENLYERSKRLEREARIPR